MKFVVTRQTQGNTHEHSFRVGGVVTLEGARGLTEGAYRSPVTR
jgi:hypothetical protein